MAPSQKSQNLTSIAYACFLFPAILAILLVINELLPFEVMNPAYFGFFVVMPLILVVVITVPAALIITFKIGRREPGLFFLSIATASVPSLAAITTVAEGLPRNIANFLYYIACIIYFLLTTVLVARWFITRSARMI